MQKSNAAEIKVSLNRASYMVLRKATAFEKQERYQSIAQFHEAWVAALNKE